MLSLQGPIPHHLELLFFGACFAAVPLKVIHALSGSLMVHGRQPGRGRFHVQLRDVGVKSLKPKNLKPLVNLDHAILAHQLVDMAARSSWMSHLDFM